jgi:hypothetical protein
MATSWNLLHVARMLKDAGGIPADGNQRSAWDAGSRFDYPNPDYRQGASDDEQLRWVGRLELRTEWPGSLGRDGPGAATSRPSRRT